MVTRDLILSPRLLIMMVLAQSLPVRMIPEQLLITTMWDDVIDDSGPRQFLFLQALDTQWMGL